MRLLLVEDHYLVVQAQRLYLSEAGHQVVGIASDTSDAVRLAGELHPDLALVDVQLAHGSNGIDAARQMLARHTVRSLFVTSDSEAARTARDAALGCLQKPYSADDLLAAVHAAEKILENGRARDCPPRLEIYRDAVV